MRIYGQPVICADGGTNLNFTVKAYDTADAMLADTPKENTICVITQTAITSWDFAATTPARRSNNKNLVTYPYYHTTMTHEGITFTDNGDGTVTANGTATGLARFRPFHNSVDYGMIWLEPGTYAVSGCPAGGSVDLDTYFWEVWDNDNGFALCNDVGDGGTFTLTSGTHVRGSILIGPGTTVSDLVFKPQIEKGSSPTSFVKGDATGQVWIITSSSSNAEFNALKKNAIQVYPLYAKQYVDGAWVDVTAMSYQGGAWVECIELTDYLYNDGDECTNITGGWGTDAEQLDGVRYDDYIELVGISQIKYGYLITKNKIDLGKTLYFDIETSNVDESVMVGAKSIIGTITYGVTIFDAVASITENVPRHIVAVDTSAVSSPIYVAIVTSGTSVAKIYNVYIG